MRYKDRDALVRDLREFADFIEARGQELPFRVGVSLSGSINTYDPRTFENRDPRVMKHELKQAVRVLKPVKKEYHGSTLNVIRKFGGLTFTLFASREVACKAVKTGNKIIHRATTIPERVEEEIEWICTDPLLKETA